MRHLSLLALTVVAAACGPKRLQGPDWVRAYEPIAQLGDYDCVVARDGRLACASEVEARVAAQLSEPIVQLEANVRFARCAVLRSGRLACWDCAAETDFSDLGNRQVRFLERAPLKFLSLPPVREIALGRSGACALTRSGSITCWGFTAFSRGAYHDEPAICKGPRAVASQPATGRISQIAMSAEGALCRLDTKNVLRCSGVGNDRVTLSLSGVRRVVSGGSHFCALTRAGDVLCWGENGRAQCGAPVESCESVAYPGIDLVDPCTVAPHRVALPEPAIDVSVGSGHSCAALRDGRVFCWGYNDEAALGFASTTRCPRWQLGLCAIEPQAIPGVHHAILVRADKRRVRTWALLSDGSVVAWPSEKKRPGAP